MNNRIYGVIGVASIMSNWNADFTGYPKTVSTGEIFGSDKALKYPMKRAWLEQGEKVLYIKSLEIHKDNLVPRMLKTRYEDLFKIKDLSKEKDVKKILENLFSSVDVKNFGATFAIKDFNLAITGAVQIGQGFNKYDGTIVDEQTIIAPFRTGEGDKNTTIGRKIQVNEAHYLYPFSINPAVYDEYKTLGVTDGYTENDYKKFKEVAISSATAFATNSKACCENEFSMFVEVEKTTYLPNLAEMITFEKREKNTFTLNCDKLLNELGDKVKSIEIYYNTVNTELVHELKNVKLFDIFTKKEV